MILSVSRRTDVPSFYFDWFVNRLRKGWLLVRNPFNPAMVSRVSLSPSDVECIVFWTKNPEPMLEKLDLLAPYVCYIQYTVNFYGRELEGYLPELSRRLDVFRSLSEKLGPERVVWRYSPVVLNKMYTSGYHRDMFGKIAEELSGYTLQCKLSFLDMYAKISPRMLSLGVETADYAVTLDLARELADAAGRNGISLSACGTPDLRPAGIAASSCVDGELIQRIVGKRMIFRKDPGQRGVCNCVESVDVGSYQTCLNGCAYCYANYSHAAAQRRAARYDPESPFLCDAAGPGDRITERKVRLHAVSGQEPFLLKA